MRVASSVWVLGLCFLAGCTTRHDEAGGAPSLETSTRRERVCAYVQEVQRSTDETSRCGVFLVLREKSCDDDPAGAAPELRPDLLIDDESLIRFVEESHHVLLEDFVGKAPERIDVELRHVRTEPHRLQDRAFARIVSLGAIKVHPGAAAELVEYDEINPACPPPSDRHRYVEVPISYANPDRGTFRLYYEVNTDFDARKPTVMIPTDAQRGSSQIGMADKYKKMFGLSYNVVTSEYRGEFCSEIPEFARRNWDWQRAYWAFNVDNAVEDVESIRKDLLGDQRMLVLGGSGTSMLALKYLSKYHEHVDRAFLMSFFKDAEGGSRSAVDFFTAFLREARLEEAFATIVRARIVEQEQLLFLLQRLLYSDQDRAKRLVTETSRNNLDLYREASLEQGHVDYFVRAPQRYRPQLVVFMNETNVPTSPNGEPDINSPFLRIGAPLQELEAAGQLPRARFDITHPERITTEVLLVAGVLDQVAPIEEMRRIRASMPQSRLAVFQSYHCMMDEDSKSCRNKLAEVFLREGMRSPRFEASLREEPCGTKFVALE